MPITNRVARTWERLASHIARIGGLADVIWQQEGRLHLRLRSLAGDDLLACKRIELALEELPGVKWARVNHRLGSVVIQTESSMTNTSQLVAAVAKAERATVATRAPVTVRHPERHPGDLAPVTRTAIEIAVDVASLGASTLLRRRSVKPIPIDVDLAALLELASNVPQVRKAIERVTSIAGTELAIEIARALVQSLLQSEVGPAVATLRRTLRIRELLARRKLWGQLEPELCSSPESFDNAWVPRGERPYPAPRGPVGPYTDKATLASLGLFAASLLLTRDVEKASASIFAGLPKPARHGRDAFASHFGYLLARAGVLVVEPHTLRRLDRIDSVLIDDRLIKDPDKASRLRDAMDASGLHFEVVVQEADPIPALRALQKAGHGVCALGLGAWPGLAVSDCGIAIAEPGKSPPWSADLICTGGLDQALVFVRGIAAARRVSEQGVLLSMAEAAFGGGLASTGLKARTTRRIMMVASAASIVGIANGIRHAHALRLPAREPGPRMRNVPPSWHRLERDEVLEMLDSSCMGLVEERAALRRQAPPKRRTELSHVVTILAGELSNPMTPVLAVGAGLSLATGAVVDAALIASVVAVNAAIGGIQRYRAEQALQALDSSETLPSRVRRGDSTTICVSPGQLVAGDVIELAAGEVVPADCRILEACALEADESSLTGESLPVVKHEHAVEADVVAERSSMLYEGTAIAAGQALALVVAVGDETEAGRASTQTEGPRAATGVAARLEKLTMMTAPIAAGAGLALVTATLARGGRPRDAIAASIGLAVAAVPEGLPLLATMAQLAAAGRLSAFGALVKEPRAIEALGRVDVLCADKTGTLTAGRIRLCLVSDGSESQQLEHLGPSHQRVLAAAMRASPSSSSGATPHLTDRALMEGARRAAVGSHDDLSGWERLDSLPFESRRAFHAGLAQHDAGLLLSVKGAPEVLLPRCSHWLRKGSTQPLTPKERATLTDKTRVLASKGFRVLAVAERPAATRARVDGKRLRNLHFYGFLAFADPVRPSARAAVSDLRRAGVDVIMVTGDHPSTAEAIAVELGLRNGRGVVSGSQLDQFDESALDAAIAHTAVFARVTPIQKVRIVAALQRAGKVVAMTGDGTNDAPAIRLADVGIALGGSSTAAARAAADLIVTNERIETIVQAILEGRGLWTSVRDAVSILVGGNLGEILFTLAGGLIAGESPLNARQLLFVNLVTDTLPALAIALRPPSAKTPEQLLSEGPDASLGESLKRDIAFRAGITAGSASAAWLAARSIGGRRGASSVGMVALTGSQLLQTFVLGGRSTLAMAASLGAFATVIAVVQTPGLSHGIGCRPIGPIGLAQAGVAIAASTVVTLVHRERNRRT